MNKFLTLALMLTIGSLQPLSANITPLCYESQANGRIVLVLSIDPTEAVLTRQTEAQIKALIDFMNEQKLDPNFRLLLMLGIREGHEARLPQSETALLKAVCPFSRMLSEDLSQKDSHGEPLYPDLKDLPSVPAENIRVQLNALLKRTPNPFAPTPASTTQNIFEEDFIDLFDQAINGYFNPIDSKRKALSLSNVNRAATIIVTNYPAPMVKEFFTPTPRMLKPSSYDDFEQLKITPGMTEAQADAVHAAREYHIRYVFNTAVQINLNHHWASSSPLTDSLIAMAMRIHAINAPVHPEARAVHAAAAGAGVSLLRPSDSEGHAGSGWACAATATSPARSGSGIPPAACGCGAGAGRPDTPTEPRPECVTPPAAAATSAAEATATTASLTEVPAAVKYAILQSYCGIKDSRMVGVISTYIDGPFREALGIHPDDMFVAYSEALLKPLGRLLTKNPDLLITCIIDNTRMSCDGQKEFYKMFPYIKNTVSVDVDWALGNGAASLALNRAGNRRATHGFGQLKHSHELIITNLPLAFIADHYLGSKVQADEPYATVSTLYKGFTNCLTNQRLVGRDPEGAPRSTRVALFEFCKQLWSKPLKTAKTQEPIAGNHMFGPGSTTAAADVEAAITAAPTVGHVVAAADGTSGSGWACAATASLPAQSGSGEQPTSTATDATGPSHLDGGTGAPASPGTAAPSEINSAEIFVDPTKACGHCGQHAKNRCTGCRQIRYCNIDCQRADRKRHKETCAVAASESATSAS